MNYWLIVILLEECKDNSTIAEHVCGPDPQNVMYVDAVSKEDGTPWYEMMVSLSLIQVVWLFLILCLFLFHAFLYIFVSTR